MFVLYIFDTYLLTWNKLLYLVSCTIAFNHLTVVLCLGKFSFWPFWPIFGQKYIACGDKLRFLTIFYQFLPICWCLFDNFCFLNQVYGLRQDKVSLGCDKKKLVIFGPFLVQNLAIFAQKSGFWLFSWKPLIRISRDLVRNSRQLLSII